MIRIIIHGCMGKMSQVLASIAHSVPDFAVAAGVDTNAGGAEGSFPVFKTLKDCNEAADVIIDFSSPEAVGGLLEGAVQKKLPLIIATTGHTDKDRALIRDKAQIIPIFTSANMSLGINLMTELAQKAAAVLGSSFDIEIIEKHHNLKKDAPSGTALALADALNEVFQRSRSYVFGRHTRTEKRTEKEIGIHAVRAGTIVGEHQILFAGKDEILKISHSAASRQIFALGALQAARFLVGRSAGLYTMQDVITASSAVTSMYTSAEEALVSINRVPYNPRVITAIFKGLGGEGINIDMISQTAPVEGQVNISFTIMRSDIEKTIRLIKSQAPFMPEYWMDVMKDIVKVTVEGAGMERQSGVAARVFEVLADLGVQFKTVTTSETKISIIIDQQDAGKAVDAFRRVFSL